MPIIVLNPSLNEPLTHGTSRGKAWYHKGDYDNAISDYTEAIRLNPNDADAYRFRGRAYRRQRKDDEALADFAEAGRLPRSPTR